MLYLVTVNISAGLNYFTYFFSSHYVILCLSLILTSSRQPYFSLREAFSEKSVSFWFRFFFKSSSRMINRGSNLSNKIQHSLRFVMLSYRDETRSAINLQWPQMKTLDNFSWEVNSCFFLIWWNVQKETNCQTIFNQHFSWNLNTFTPPQKSFSDFQYATNFCKLHGPIYLVMVEMNSPLYDGSVSN